MGRFWLSFVQFVSRTIRVSHRWLVVLANFVESWEICSLSSKIFILMYSLDSVLYVGSLYTASQICTHTYRMSQQSNLLSAGRHLRPGVMTID